MTSIQSFTTKICILVVLVTSIFPSSSLSSPVNRGDDTALATMEAVRSDLLSILKGQDRSIVQNVVFFAPLSSVGIAGVNAYLDQQSGEPCISMNTGAHYAILQISKCFQIAKYVLKQDQDAYLLGYIRYLAYWASFRDEPMTAVKFAEYYGAKDVQKNLDKLDPNVQAEAVGIFRVLNTFIVAHELAHHVKMHVETPFALPNENRERESVADKWAAERLQDIGVPPELAIMSMLVINELENGSLKGELVRDHPAALRRSIEILNSSISRLKDQRPQIESAFFKSSAKIDFDTYEKGLYQLKALVQSQLDYELRLDNEPGFIIERAKDGDTRAQMRLAEAYLQGNQNGIALDRTKAIIWSKIVALRNTPYHYFDTAFANYMAGTLISSSDQKQGCFFVALAQKMGLIVADLQMRVFKEKQSLCIP